MQVIGHIADPYIRALWFAHKRLGKMNKPIYNQFHTCHRLDRDLACQTLAVSPTKTKHFVNFQAQKVAGKKGETLGQHSASDAIMRAQC